MYGLEAISAHNGWAMAVTGPLIVISGLSILALIISQMDRLTAIFDKKNTADEPEEISAPNRVPDDTTEAAKIYQPLINKLEQPFELHTLYQIAQKHNFPHPTLTVSRFREDGILRSEGEGLFTWNR